MADRPKATCRKHNQVVELKQFNTFCYWWCAACKDEPESVSLDVVHWSRAQRHYEAYEIKDPTDIVLSGSGIWKLTYRDGSSEFYEKHPGSPNLTLRREQVQSATRLADSDLPSRKPLQSLSISREGEIEKRQGLRAVPDAKDSVQRDSTFSEMLAALYPSPASSSLPDDFEITLQDLAQDDKCIQHWPVPPDDEL